MTGYASASSQPASDGDNTAVNKSSVSVELRSVNGRFLDLGFRMPEELRGLEPALRELLTAQFKRGKIEMRINAQREGDNAWPQPQPEQLNRLSRLESTVQGWLPKAQPLSVHEVLQWCKNGGGAAEKLDEATLEAARACVAGLAEAREREGEKLVAILMERVKRLRALAAEAEPLVPAVVQRQQQRFIERWQEALTASGATQTITEEQLRERALNEAAAYAIRIDVAEELARLRAHLDEITRLLKKGGEVGKRLDFLIQELLREANTLGSKAAALELTNISVEMKVAIEQLREQVQNLE
ncbi:YicC/YloC family endoribonuclease [Pelomonas sp. KK5]|uniref:YicC/YloC family endoribonuclease n=1 Tax=Pelomonas sp. KK5 TaxID=1855730 RepID=UPI0026F42E97|nr:YicC/YloC family endoribonuclease [Pelomonas sp. KK5]